MGKKCVKLIRSALGHLLVKLLICSDCSLIRCTLCIQLVALPWSTALIRLLIFARPLAAATGCWERGTHICKR